MAKSAIKAKIIFEDKLFDALNDNNIIYVITEKQHLELLPEGAFKILVTADLTTIKERFKKRMNGNLPKSVEAMLEKKHSIFKNIKYDYHYDDDKDIKNLLLKIKDIMV